MALVMYERLIRNDPMTGEYKGSHVKLFDTVTMRESEAMSLEKAESLGFSSSDVLSATEIGAIKAADLALAEIEVLKSKLEKFEGF